MTPNEVLLAYLHEAVEGESYVPREKAEEIDDRWRRENRETYEAWLKERRVDFIMVRLQHYARTSRSLILNPGTIKSTMARFVATATAGGDTSLLVRWRCRVDEDGTQASIGSMGKSDHLFVARAYDARANSNAMYAAFHRAVAKHIGDERTDHVFDERKLVEMFYSITREREPLALAA